MSKAFTLTAFGAGIVAAILLARRRPALAAGMYEFPPEIVTHSPEFLAREEALQTGRKVMQDAAFKVTLAEFAAEKDAQKKAAIKTKLDAEIAKRKAAEAAEAKKPTYPVGLQVKFGKRQATIVGAKQDAAGAWIYDIDLKAGELLGLGDGVYTKTEPEMRQIIAGEVGQPLVEGQLFPANIQVYRGGQGGQIAKVEKNAAGEWNYTITGWPNVVTQAEFWSILRK